jgi:hypothetical protein
LAAGGAVVVVAAGAGAQVVAVVAEGAAMEIRADKVRTTRAGRLPGGAEAVAAVGAAAFASSNA